MSGTGGRQLQQRVEEPADSTNPLSRRWICAWTLLTWVVTITFAIFTLVVFVDHLYSENTDRNYVRADRLLKNIPCLYKEPWTDVEGVKGIYRDVSTAYPTGTSVSFNAAGSDIILGAVLRKMRCHGNKAAELGTPLAGGIPGAVATQAGLASIFAATAPVCTCVADKHVSDYQSAYVASGGATAANALAEEYLKELGTECFMPLQKNRMPQIISEMESCALAVSPFAVAMYCNSLAGMFGVFYMLNDSAKYNALHYGGTALLVLVNLSMGIAVLAVSQQAAGMAFTITFQALGAIAVFLGAFFVWHARTRQGKPGAVGARVNGMVEKILDRENVQVVQRSVFWLQYMLTMPAIVVLHDMILQQRLFGYLIVRVFMSVGICFLAAGYDMAHICAEKYDMSGTENSPPRPIHQSRFRSINYFCWACWVLAVSCLVYTSEPLQVHWAFVDTSAGASSTISLVFALYVLGMPILCMPNGVSAFYKSVNSSTSEKMLETVDADNLGLRLALEFICRILLSLTVLFWLSEPAVPLP